MTKWCKAKFLSEVGKKTHVFTRFSAVNGERGASDNLRDNRGFAYVSDSIHTSSGHTHAIGSSRFHVSLTLASPQVPPFPNDDLLTPPLMIYRIKFYTEEGNYDMVGMNFPVFSIRDAFKFPDLIHASKRQYVVPFSIAS